MATSSVKNSYTLDKNQAEMVANTPKVNVEKPPYANKFHLSLEERKKRASDILNKWKRP